jgi:hypothetical protein
MPMTAARSGPAGANFPSASFLLVAVAVAVPAGLPVAVGVVAPVAAAPGTFPPQIDEYACAAEFVNGPLQKLLLHLYHER